MKYKKKSGLAAAIIFLISLAMFISAYLFFTGYYKNKNLTSVKVKFQNLSSIQKGSSVAIFGVDRGRIQKIKIVSDGVIAYCLVDLPFPLKKGTIFRITQSNMMGDGKIEIIPSQKGDLLDTSQVIKGENGVSISQMLHKISDIADKIDNLAGGENTLERIDEIITKFGNLLSKLSDFTDDKKINKIINNISEASQNLNKLLKDNNPKITKIVNKTDENMDEISKVIKKIDKISDDMQKITHSAKENDNNLNALVKDKKLYDNLLRTSAKLDSLITDIKKNPKKYFNVKVF